jgi:hypothetical protein
MFVKVKNVLTFSSADYTPVAVSRKPLFDIPGVSFRQLLFAFLFITSCEPEAAAAAASGTVSFACPSTSYTYC